MRRTVSLHLLVALDDVRHAVQDAGRIAQVDKLLRRNVASSGVVAAVAFGVVSLGIELSG